MARASLFAGLIGISLSSSPLLAQSKDVGEAEAGDRSIVVTGKRDEAAPTGLEITRQAREITAQRGIRYRPLPRFEGESLCPGVFGLESEHASLMIDRLRANAERFDLRMTKDDGTCSPNFIVAFVEDGGVVLRQLAEARSRPFTRMPLAARRELLSQKGPVRVWTRTVTRTRDGITVSESPDGVGVVSLWNASSRLYLPIRLDIISVLVLFDRDEVKEKTLLQLADYATIRGLARTTPVDSEGLSMDTILSLFDPDGTPPAKMTAFDRAYLGSLYSGLPNLTGISKVLGVNRQLRRESEAQQEEVGAGN